MTDHLFFLNLAWNWGIMIENIAISVNENYALKKPENDSPIAVGVNNFRRLRR